MNNSPNTTPWGSSSVPSRSAIRVSQNARLGWLALGASSFALGVASVGGVKVVIDVLGTGIEDSLDILPAKVMVVGLAYVVGWALAIISVRVFDNQVMPLIICFFMVFFLLALCSLYALVLWKFYYDLDYTLLKFWAYLIMLTGTLAALVGLHLIFEDNNLRGFSYFLLFMSLVHLGSMVCRYVFLQMDAKYLWMDLLFFFTMGGSGALMLAHIGLLKPLQEQIAGYTEMSRRFLE